MYTLPAFSACLVQSFVQDTKDLGRSPRDPTARNPRGFHTVYPTPSPPSGSPKRPFGSVAFWGDCLKGPSPCVISFPSGCAHSPAPGFPHLPCASPPPAHEPSGRGPWALLAAGPGSPAHGRPSGLVARKGLSPHKREAPLLTTHAFPPLPA